MEAQPNVLNLQNMNRKLRYYHIHKDDPNFKQRMSDAKRRYYLKNRDAIIAKSLTRYYANKLPEYYANHPPEDLEENEP
jgi:hypothetical protein